LTSRLGVVKFTLRGATTGVLSGWIRGSFFLFCGD
jgi:hypothetical protein